MKVHLDAFLEQLALNENASDHTARAYESDLSQFLSFLAEQTRRKLFYGTRRGLFGQFQGRDRVTAGVERTF